MMMIGGGKVRNKIKKEMFMCVCNWDMNNKMR